MSYTYKYPRPGLVTDIAAFTLINEKLHVVLIKRGIEPYKGSWALPGGFVHDNESPIQCATRELSEESALKIPHKYLTEFSVYGKPGRDPRGWVVSVAFYALVPNETVLETSLMGGSDSVRAKWFPYDELPILAFDHQDIIRDAHQRLIDDIFGTSGGQRNEVFSFLPKEFTLRELLETLQCIKEEKFVRSTFVKTAEKNFSIEKTGKFIRNQSNKPPELYRLKETARQDF